MEQIGAIINGNNGLTVIILFACCVALLALAVKNGIISFKGKGLSVGHTESETRSLLIKQKDYVIQYCHAKSQEMLSLLHSFGIEENPLYVSYTFEKTIDLCLGWLLVNNISEDKEYLESKKEEVILVVNKSVYKVNPSIMHDEQIKDAINKKCAEWTTDIIRGLLRIKRLEGF